MRENVTKNYEAFEESLGGVRGIFSYCDRIDLGMSETEDILDASPSGGISDDF